MNQAKHMCRLRSGGQEILALVTELQVLTDPKHYLRPSSPLSAFSVPLLPNTLLLRRGRYRFHSFSRACSVLLFPSVANGFKVQKRATSQRWPATAGA